MIHQNSLSAFDLLESKGILNAREKAILRIRINNIGYMRDSDYLAKFRPGSDNINLVQPRLTSMIEKNILLEGPPGRSLYQNSAVRTTYLNPIHEPKKQMDLF